jgi:outer membrane protein assembly factor BamD (BamD/ComL family)
VPAKAQHHPAAPPVKLSLRSEDSMNLYERACLYLEFGEWNKAVTLLEAAAQRLHAHSPARPPA